MHRAWVDNSLPLTPQNPLVILLVTPFSRGHRFLSLAHSESSPPKTQLQGKENLLFPTYLSPKDLGSFSYTGQNPGLVPASLHPRLGVFSRSPDPLQTPSPTSAETATWSHGRSGDTLFVHGSRINCAHKPQAKSCPDTLQEPYPHREMAKKHWPRSQSALCTLVWDLPIIILGGGKYH